MSKTKRRRLTCAICPIYTASSGWCAVRACRRLRGKSADGSDSRTYNRRAPKVQLILSRSISAADAMTRHLRKNHGYFGAAAEVKAGGQN